MIIVNKQEICNKIIISFIIYKVLLLVIKNKYIIVPKISDIIRFFFISSIKSWLLQNYKKNYNKYSKMILILIIRDNIQIIDFFLIKLKNYVNCY